MKNYKQVLAFLSLTTVPLILPAAELDGSAPMLCAVTQSVACDPQGDCVEGPADAVNLPIFFKVDPENKLVVSARRGGDRRTSKISSMNTDGDGIVLVGFEPRGGWSATIDKATGKMTVSIAEQGIGYLVFGSCLKL